MQLQLVARANWNNQCKVVFMHGIGQHMEVCLLTGVIQNEVRMENPALQLDRKWGPSYAMIMQ